jgi:hypothetical protein
MHAVPAFRRGEYILLEDIPSQKTYLGEGVYFARRYSVGRVCGGRGESLPCHGDRREGPNPYIRRIYVRKNRKEW